MKYMEYLGTYQIRRIDKSEQGIHMPPDAYGDYRIERDEQGRFVLTPVGVKNA